MRFPAALLSLLLTAAAVPGAAPATWTIDPEHSSVMFTVRHMLVSSVRGEFDPPTGTVVFDPANIAATEVNTTINAKSISTRNQPRDMDLKSADFFDVAKYPRITFKSRRAEPTTAGNFKLVGDLTMHGVTKEVTLNVEGPSPEIVDLSGDRRLGAAATTTVDRRDFGLLYNELIEGGGAVVSNQVTITIDLEVTRKK
jgi:polyisoprenoid-binding protein YceI